MKLLTKHSSVINRANIVEKFIFSYNGEVSFVSHRFLKHLLHSDLFYSVLKASSVGLLFFTIFNYEMILYEIDAESNSIHQFRTFTPAKKLSPREKSFSYAKVRQHPLKKKVLAQLPAVQFRGTHVREVLNKPPGGGLKGTPHACVHVDFRIVWRNSYPGEQRGDESN